MPLKTLRYGQTNLTDWPTDALTDLFIYLLFILIIHGHEYMVLEECS